jgi:dihydrodipicolinate synthase/N-acetylneuraminate lyase
MPMRIDSTSAKRALADGILRHRYERCIHYVECVIRFGHLLAPPAFRWRIQWAESSFANGKSEVVTFGQVAQSKAKTMPRHKDYIPHGVIPAVLLPFDNDLAIDEANFRRHLRDVEAVEGLSAITINAHSTEVASCTFDEQRRVLDLAQDEIGGRMPLINGVWADGSLEAARIAKMATQGGASALLVFPPAPFTLGQSSQMALAHFKRIADATDLPLIAFEYPLATGQGYPKDTLLKLCEEVPTIRAIKDWIGNVSHHEWHIQTLQNLPRPVNVLTTHSAWLYSSLVLGCNGLLRLGQRDRRFAGAAVPCRASERHGGSSPSQ